MAKKTKKTTKSELTPLSDRDKAVLKGQLPKLEASLDRPSVKFDADDKGNLAIYNPKGSVLALAEIANTTGCMGKDAGIVLLNQVMNLLPPDSQQEANALSDWMNGIAPENEVEGMLAAQMVASHYMVMKFAARASKNDTHVSIDANTKRMTKLMGAFSKHLETLQKYRNKGQQTIQVQHVQVNDGGQAIVGNVTQTKGGE